MKKNILIMLAISVLIGIVQKGWTQNRIITGKVIAEADGEAIQGVTLAIDNHGHNTTSNNLGEFRFEIPPQTKRVLFNHISYAANHIQLQPDVHHYVIRMKQLDREIAEVLVSTGYQNIPKERSTGSFELIDNELLNRSVSADILSRIEHVSNSVLFDRRRVGSPQISVRGISTIESDASPLIIVDNFPYEGDINNINPNDIANISILKDASASSIWGARAGNGVIVITTKKGKLQQPIKVTVNANLTFGGKPDVYYDRRFLNSPEFIEVEKYLFANDYYTWMETEVSAPPLSPAVELLIKEREGDLSTAEMLTEIENLTQIDVRDDYKKYIFQSQLNQQYSLSLTGGNDNTSFYLHAGHDNNRPSLVRNNLNRTSINTSVSYFPIKALELSSQLVFTDHHESFNNTGLETINSGGGRSIYPYAQLADGNGNPLSIGRDYNRAFVAQAPDQGLLDWSYRPLDEISNANHRSRRSEIRINTLLKYNLSKEISMEGRYQYQNQYSNTRNLQERSLYYVRNLQNQYAYVDDGGILQFPVPKGAILDNSTVNMHAHFFRGQLNLDKRWALHEINAIAGYEIRQAKTAGIDSRLYGYDDDKLTSVPVDHITQFLVMPYYYNATIPTGDYLTGLLDRNSSFFANMAYAYDNRYILSASARNDRSNLFGVKSNQKAVPLWSVGSGWRISSERFYPFSSTIPELKLRATYGFSGNVNKSLTAYATGVYSTDFTTGMPYLQLLTPPNPSLRWEKVRTINYGLDFTTKNGTVSGSIELYTKNGTDLIGKISIDPTIGHSVGGRNEFVGNNASLKAKGVDINLNFNKEIRQVRLSSQLLFSYNRDEITRYAYEQTTITSHFSPIPVPVEGNNRHALYSLRWAGLDESNGDPQIYVGGEVNKDYSRIMSLLGKEDVLYNGPSLPKYFGSWRNSVTVRNFTVGFNITYKLGHFFRRSSIDYAALYNNSIGHVDFNDRWKTSGDGSSTQIPSMPAPGTSSTRDYIYTFSDLLIEKADHIRLQDINLRYDFSRNSLRRIPFETISVYGYINNVGMLWRSNRYGIDPDYTSRIYPPVTTYSIGIKAQF
ncbi:SusC/RagA family TonB-linked outer membrane protein [Sphingobacterium sp. DN00404]|uniref:SusC/RagA family TonB-linked outer membrane protein n=1 Tax=Sphingobacterium micropteri TaxID=2763501 RepID=A0ABR7YKC1_9SPHI|nr:SusC/RagA family TonB-linked outer membrane protein [Sphingobacterium micropteri]MBD1431771.1 SusC/RagA family TonB-linked outer membrane protein [Sphingobacterium micropteri]